MPKSRWFRGIPKDPRKETMQEVQKKKAFSRTSETCEKSKFD
jgi:hypothetical protein